MATLVALVFVIVILQRKKRRQRNDPILNHKVKTFVKKLEKEQTVAGTPIHEDLTPEDMFLLAEMYHYGRFGVKTDLDRAEALYKESARLGFPRANMNLGIMYYECRKDALTSISYLMQAHRCGVDESLLHLGTIYVRGIHPHYHGRISQAVDIYVAALSSTKEEVRREAYIQLLNIKNASRTGVRDEVWANSGDLPALNLDPVVKTIPPNEGTGDDPAAADRLDPLGRVLQRGSRRRRLDRAQDPPRRDPVLDLIAAQPRQIILRDSQNAHDHSLQSSAVNALRKMQDINPSEYDRVAGEVIAGVEKSTLTNYQKQQAVDVLLSLGTDKHSRYNMSERDILQKVWSRVQDPVNEKNRENLSESLARGLSSAVEDGIKVCSTGKIVRIMGSLDGIDAENIVSLKPEWAVSRELETLAPKIREDVLKQATEQDRTAFDSLNPTSEEATAVKQLQERMVTTVRQKAKEDYVDTGILSKEVLDVKLAPILEALQE